jgi:transporter family protein
MSIPILSVTYKAAQRTQVALSVAVAPCFPAAVRTGGRGMAALLGQWQVWAVMAAVFAALTAIFAKVGIASVGSDMATLLRTFVIVPFLALVVMLGGQWQSPAQLSGRTLGFIALSGLATGASWLCYFRALKLGDAARVAPVDKLSVVLVAVFGVVFLGERLSAVNWAGVALIAAGAVLVAWKV